MDRNGDEFTRPTRSMAAPTATVSDGSGIYDNVNHKNHRHSGGGGNRNGRSRSRSRDGNRDRIRNGGNFNNAKGAHQSPKDRLLGREAKRRQESCKIPTGGQRQPPTKDTRRSINPSKRPLDDPSDQSDTGTKTSFHYDSANPRTSNAKTDRTQRQLHEAIKERSVLERIKNFYARRKALCWVLLGFAVLAIVGVIILGIVLGIPKTTTTDVTPETYRGELSASVSIIIIVVFVLSIAFIVGMCGSSNKSKKENLKQQAIVQAPAPVVESKSISIIIPTKEELEESTMPPPPLAPTKQPTKPKPTAPAAPSDSDSLPTGKEVSTSIFRCSTTATSTTAPGKDAAMAASVATGKISKSGKKHLKKKSEKKLLKKKSEKLPKKETTKKPKKKTTKRPKKK